MRKLIVAFKVDASSVYREDLLDENTYIYCGLASIDPQYLRRRVFRPLSTLIAVYFFSINKVYCRRLGVKSDCIFNAVSRNYFNELILRLLVWIYDIDEVAVHWSGYGFLPYGSVQALSSKAKIRLFHHDWVHFTGGCHVPSSCDQWKLGCRSCPCTNDNKDLSQVFQTKSERCDAVEDVFVSQYQFVMLNTLPTSLKNYSVLPNRDVGILPKSEPVRKLRRAPVIAFIGVRAGNLDNKGLAVSSAILSELEESDVLSIAVGCSSDLPASLSFERLDNPDVLKVLSQVDFLIVASKIETFSMVSYEACLAGCTVLCRKGLVPNYWNTELVRGSDCDCDECFKKFVVSEVLNA
jgi:hypothetical protein